MKYTIHLLLVLIVGFICLAVEAAVNQKSTLSPQTTKNLTTAMKGEAFASAKYQLYADRARQGGNNELADLFEKTAKVEHFEHFKEESELAGLVGTDQANLKDAIAGESYEVETMYREFAKQAEAAGDKEAAKLFEEIRKDEAGHRDEFKAALKKIGPKTPGGQ